jgi:HlyD family secretion protein
MKTIYKFLHSVRKHWVRSAIIVVALLGAFLLYKQFTKRPQGVTSEVVKRSELTTSFSANGEIKAKKQADLKFYSPGKVVWVGVKRGDKVRAWQGVASLDSVALDAVYQQALNNYRNYQAIADQVLDEVKDHSSDESFSLKATRTTAEVNRDNSYDAMLGARANLKNAALVSPIAGTVTDINDVQAGLNLTGSDLETKFIRVVDLSSLYFEARLHEVDYSKVKVGQEVNVNVDAYPSDTCNGKVSFVGKVGQETTGGVISIPVEITLEKCSLDFAVGLNGQAHFVTSKLSNVLIIPKKYIVTKDGQDSVWKQTGENIKQRKLVPVKIGASSSTEAEVTEGLQEGDKIVFIP